MEFLRQSYSCSTALPVVATSFLLGLGAFLLVTRFFSNHESTMGSSSKNKKKEKNSSASSTTTTTVPKKQRDIMVCPFSNESTFVMQTDVPKEESDHSSSSSSPLDLFETWRDHLGIRWLAAGISGQDQPGYLRAQLRRLNHPRHFLLQDWHLEEELALKETAFRERYHSKFVMESDSSCLDAQRETLELFMAYLPRHYPNTYHYDRESHSITVTTSNVQQRSFRLDDYRDRPLELCARIVQEDLVLLRRHHHDNDGGEGASSSYNMAAAAVVFSFNELPERLGQTTNFIHAPVPGFERHLAKVVDLTFKNLQVDKPLWRNNWSLVPSDRIDEPSDNSTHGSELQAFLSDQTGGIRERFLKVEYQTIRRLPRNSNYLLFTVRTFVDPMSALLEESVPAKAAATLAASIRGMTSSSLKYRGIESEAIRKDALDYLDSISSSSSSSKKG